ncbi:MAG: hypothetical protein E7581_06270 [Ruminococcaceae bacterium]|nr:hypothetical protein [Oscillospiraceae bacterium]
MKHSKLLSLFLCLCLTFALLLPTLSSCTESGSGDDTTEELTSAETEQENASDPESAPDTQKPETDTTEPGSSSDTDAQDPTLPDTEGTDTIPETEGDSTTEGETQPPVQQAQSLPILRIETADGGDVTSKDYYKTCTITLENCSDPMKFEGIGASIRVRGNSTAVAEKKPFRIKFDTKRNVLGLNDGAKCKSWCLMADYYDHSLMRNSLSFRMCAELLDGYSFASECAWVEVYLNGDYRGVYLLCEQTQINKHRVNIYEKLDDETNVEIGYLMVGQGGRTDEPNTVQINYGGMPFSDLNGTTMGFGGGNFSLSSGDYTQEQIDYCAKYVGNIAQLVASAIVENVYYDLDEDGDLVKKTDFTGTTEAQKQIETIEAHVDIESAVRMYMTDEIVKNLDSGTFNMYIDLSPDGAKKLTFGPPWDFDFALANTHYDSTHSYKGLYAANFSYSDGMRVNTWFVLFCQAEWFRDMCEPIWMEHRDQLFEICDSILIDAEQHKDAFDRNFDRWNIMGRVTQGHQAGSDIANFSSHSDVAEFLNNWLYKRLVYLDTVWGDRVVSEDEEDKEFSNIDFTQGNRSELFTDYKSSKSSYVSKSYLRLSIDGEAHDPYVHIRYEDNGATLDADDYSVIQITYRVPVTNSQKENTTELFLCAGDYFHPTGGISVQFDVEADGEWHTVRIPIPGHMWIGTVHQIRLDFLAGGERGDSFDLQSLILTN